jgi:hypothetical protein
MELIAGLAFICFWAGGKNGKGFVDGVGVACGHVS